MCNQQRADAYAGGLDERLELLVELVDLVLFALDEDHAFRDLCLRARDDVAFSAQLVEQRARDLLELLDARAHVTHFERLLRDCVLGLDDLRLLRTHARTHTYREMYKYCTM